MDIVASAPGRGTAARALIDCATRAWRLKYPTSKNDDCAAVCLFLEHVPMTNEPKPQNEAVPLTNEPKPQIDTAPPPEEENRATLEAMTTSPSEADPDNDVNSPASKESSEIVPVVEEMEEKRVDKSVGQSRRSLAECLSSAEDEEWSALEGITRVNSLLSLPRFLPLDRRSTSWRKWL